MAPESSKGSVAATFSPKRLATRGNGQVGTQRAAEHGSEALLSSVLLGHAKTHPQIRGLVNSAKASVRSAKESIGHPSASAATKPVMAKAENNRRQSRMGPRAPAAGAARRKRAAKRAVGPKALADKAVSRNQRRTSQKQRALNPQTAARVPGSRSPLPPEVYRAHLPVDRWPVT
jgi:hypothetical protein